MRISEVEAIVEDQKEEVQVDNIKVSVVASIQDTLRELQKSAQVEVQRDDAIEIDDGLVQNTQQDVASPTPSPSEKVEFAAAVLQLVENVPDLNPAGKEIIDLLLQSGQAVPQDAGAQARADMEQAGERQTQGNQDQTMGEMRMKDFALNEEQTSQAIQMFAKNGEVTPAEVRETAAELAAALPQQLADVRQQMEDATPEETAGLRQQRAELAQQVGYYESFVKVLDVVAPAPDQNALTADDMNARAESVRNEPRYAGSPGAAGEISESRTGVRYNEYNAAEVGLGLRADYDPNLGYARSVEWDVGAQIGNYGTRPEKFTRDEPLVEIKAEQAVHKDFTNTLAERGHAAGQQFSGGDADIAAELMKMSNVWVMQGRGPEGVNQGAYKDVEDSIVKMRADYPDDAINVRVDAVIEGEPEFLVNARGQELVVPDRFEFTITRTPADGGESVVERMKVLNRDEEDR